MTDDLLTVIDFHSHILPEIDHGCMSISECRSQLSLMRSNGTDIVVATPHFYPHEHKLDVFLERRDHAVDKILQGGITESPKIAVGAEVLLCNNLHNMDGFEQLCIKGTDVLLLELPPHRLDDSLYETVEAMINGGITVVLAHIDRYLPANEHVIDTLLSMGALAQVNAYSLFSGKLKKKIFEYLEFTARVCSIGSDLHGVDIPSYKKFVKSKKILKEHYPIVMRRASTLLEGAELIEL